FFSSRRRHTRFSRDWSSDVCSSDLGSLRQRRARRDARPRAARLDHLHSAAGAAPMNDETRFIAAVLKELANSTAVILAAWGALEIGRASCRERGEHRGGGGGDGRHN